MQVLRLRSSQKRELLSLRMTRSFGWLELFKLQKQHNSNGKSKGNSKGKSKSKSKSKSNRRSFDCAVRKSANCFAQDDTIFWLVGFVLTAKATATANNGNGKSEMRGSLHCATDDETVRRFGRDDAFY